MNLQTMILKLQNFWAKQNCIIGQPYDVEKGAGTMNTSTFLHVLGPESWTLYKFILFQTDKPLNSISFLSQMGM